MLYARCNTTPEVLAPLLDKNDCTTQNWYKLCTPRRGEITVLSMKSYLGKLSALQKNILKIFSETLAHVKSHHHSSAWGEKKTKSFQNITDRWLFAASGAYKIDFINFVKNPPGIRLMTKSHNQTFGLEHHQHVLHEFFSPENTERHKTHVLLVMVPILLKQGFCK